MNHSAFTNMSQSEADKSKGKHEPVNGWSKKLFMVKQVKLDLLYVHTISGKLVFNFELSLEVMLKI